MKQPASRRGVALVLVLWLLVVLGGIGAGVTASARTASSLTANQRARVVARYAAESGVEATVARVEALLASSPDSASRAATLNALEPESRRADSIAIGDGRFTVSVIDASARLDVNAAPEANLATLLAFFTDAGRASDAARRIRIAIDGAALPGGPNAAPGTMPGAGVRPLRALDELRRIPGIDDRLLRLAAPYLTVDGDGTINGAAASDTVLDAAFGEIRGEPSRLVIVSRGWMRGHPLTTEIQAVYGVSVDRLVLIAWRERIL